MVKKLTKTGNSLALVLDKPLLNRLKINGRTPLEVSTDGQVIVISPVRDRRRTARLKRIVEEAHRQYGGVFRRLAE
jgi:antitoxin component of MazEF toxin-antitoxin module